ncbi:hypothetical protein Metho_0567 [Methanomethylovorans hollandica DSM 15978]|uniref:LVIVD repeat protein n=1 Tax=Methanomethylovorans hollandica (strain DSM 15978 / NBRC 107637 / DMS1) TaxID=867904 RepID=L0KTV3_METHD|nr:PGF-pre-PGF domain-containing protein [Methanomethylovorans hollandica]AGB48832.1 hypothetical protein Metho_0567 [Methanomethylovorans hollandica DSM 15978]
MINTGICSADNVNVDIVGQFSGDIFNVFVAGNYAYLGQGQDLVIIDTSDVTAISELGRVTSMSEIYGIDISGNYAYIANGDAGITVIDISNPASPTILGSYDTDGFARDIAISGNYAYVADVSSLLIVDISVPSSPTLVGTYDTIGFANGVTISGDHVYVADDVKGVFDGSYGLVILDISNPSSPGLVGTYDLVYAYNSAVSDNYAYVADDSGLSILDISVPSSPAPVGRYSGAGDSNGVAVSGNYVYVADASGVFVVDVTDPSAPVYMGSYDGAYVYNVAVSGNYAYAASDNGLLVFTLTDPSSPGVSPGNSADNATPDGEADQQPVILETGDKSVYVNELLTFRVSATDEDGDVIMYSASDLPEGAIFDATTGIFSWTPETEGNYIVTFTAESNGLTASETITIDVSSSGGVTPDSPGSQISDISGEDISSSSITLTWTNSPDVVLVELSRNDIFIANVSGSVYEDNDLDSDTSYTYSLLPHLSDGSKGVVESIDLSTSSSFDSDTTGGERSSSSSGTMSSSSGGGGGAGSAEDFENVVLKDAATVYLMMDSNATYEFIEQYNPIQAVSFYSLKNSGEVTSTIEVLYNRSKFASSDVEGLVYKYVNIWVGKSGFATEGNIKDPMVQFRVNNSWIEETGVNPASIRLQRYDGTAWEVLPTVFKANTTSYVIFEAQTPGFSPFAITADATLDSVNTDTKLQSADPDVLSDPVLNKSGDYGQAQPERSNFWAPVIVVLIIGLLAAGYMYLKKK